MLVRRRGIQIAAGAAIVALALAACSSSKKNSAATSVKPRCRGYDELRSRAQRQRQRTGGGQQRRDVRRVAADQTKTGNRLTGNPNTINTATVTKGGTLTYALEKTIDNWNMLTSAGDTFETAEVENSIYPSGIQRATRPVAGAEHRPADERDRDEFVTADDRVQDQPEGSVV